MALSQSDAATFAMAVKKARPDVTDEELGALVREAGEVNDDPIKSQALAMKMLPQLNTQLADPYAGSGYTSADSMKQFNPQQMRAALAQQQAAYQRSQPSRAIGNIMAGSSGSEAVMNKNKADWEGIDAQNMLQSLGAQEKLQGQATAGINAAKGVQDMAEKAGKYSGTQIEQQQKLQGAQLTLEQQKRLNLASSPETMFAKKLMASQLQSNPALANDPDLKKALQDPNVTAQVLMGFMDKNVLDAYKKQVGIVSDETKARGDQAVSSSLTGGTQPVIGSGAPLPSTTTSSGPAPTFNFKPGTNMREVRAVMAKSAPEHLAAFDAQFPDAANAPTGPTAPVLSADAKERMKFSPITAAGQTLVPHPVDVAKGAGAGKEAADFNERVRTYKNYVEPQIDTALTKLESTSSGKGTEMVARLLPANEQQELVNMLAQVNNMYPGAVPASISGNIAAAQKAGGFTGSPLASLTTAQLKSALKMIKANTQREINYQQEKDKSEKTSGAGSYGAAQKTSPTPLPQRNSKGWELHTDGAGNRAYVSPDRKQFEEVK